MYVYLPVLQGEGDTSSQQLLARGKDICACQPITARQTQLQNSYQCRLHKLA